MEKVTTYCTECSQHLQFHKEFAGRAGMCPHCEAIQMVPATDVSQKAEAGEGEKKCPNCFEYSDSKVKSCAYCGEFMGKYELNETCPNCKEEQPPGNQYCCKCGVNIKSGLYDGVVRRTCPRCGILSSGMETVCVVCKTPLDASATVVRSEDNLKKVVRFISDNAAVLFLLCFLAIAAYITVHWREIEGSFTGSYYGKEEAGLRKEVQGFSAALKYRDWATISQMLTTPQKLGYRDFPKVAGISRPRGTALYELDFAEVSKVTISGTDATVYLDLACRKFDMNADEERAAEEDLTSWMSKLKETGAQSAVQKQPVTWRWSNLDGKWLRILEEGQ